MEIPGLGTLVIHGNSDSDPSEPLTMSQRLGQLYATAPEKRGKQQQSGSGSSGGSPAHTKASSSTKRDDSDSNPPKTVFTVKFKRISRNFTLSKSLQNKDFKVGMMVKVEADRGEDLGRVTTKVSAK